MAAHCSNSLLEASTRQWAVPQRVPDLSTRWVAAYHPQSRTVTCWQHIAAAGWWILSTNNELSSQTAAHLNTR